MGQVSLTYIIILFSSRRHVALAYVQVYDTSKSNFVLYNKIESKIHMTLSQHYWLNTLPFHTELL